MPFSNVVQLVQAGDREAMATLYSFLSRGLRPHLARRMHLQDVPDTLHDVFLEVVGAIQRDQLRDAECIMGFARTVARRRVGIYLAILVRTRRDQAEFSAVFHRSALPNPEGELISRQRREIAGRALIQLADRERDILTRYYIQDQPPTQICQEMGLTNTQFRLLKWRSKARLQQLSRKALAGKRRPVRSAASVPASIPA